MQIIKSILQIKADESTEESARADLKIPDPQPALAKALLNDKNRTTSAGKSE